jgi:predicted secreted protein
MTVSTAIAVFVLVWWISLFAVLPWGVRSQHEGEDGEMVPGTDPGAPIVHRVGRKLLWTTVVAAVIYGIGAFAYRQHWVSLEGLTKPLFGDVKY